MDCFLYDGDFCLNELTKHTSVKTEELEAAYISEFFCSILSYKTAPNLGKNLNIFDDILCSVPNDNRD